MSDLHVLECVSVAGIPERIPSRIREWSNEWFRCIPREALCEQLKQAQDSFTHVSEMKQMTARLIWQVRIERLKEELRRRTESRDVNGE